MEFNIEAIEAFQTELVQIVEQQKKKDDEKYNYQKDIITSTLSNFYFCCKELKLCISFSIFSLLNLFPINTNLVSFGSLKFQKRS